MTTKNTNGHRYKLALAGDAMLDILTFSMKEVRWIFKHIYRRRVEERGDVDVFNETTLVVNYIDGIITSPITLSMHVIVPRRLGQKFFAGVDISPGAKTFVEFVYAPIATDDWQLVEIGIGANKRWRLLDQKPGLMKPVEFPFPAPDRIKMEFGTLSIPFLKNDDNIGTFVMPRSIERKD